MSYNVSAWKKCWVSFALHDNSWISRINMSNGLSLVHILEFFELWSKLQDIQVVHGVRHEIKWKFTQDGVYSSSTAYKMQFVGLISSDMPRLVWKCWAPPKFKFFAWLILQDRVWTADHLQRRGWPNCETCKLCIQEPETSGGSSPLWLCIHS